MKKILEIKKEAKGYHIIFDDETISLYPEIYHKYHLNVLMLLDEKTINEIKDDQNYLSFYLLGIKKLKKMMTVKEMENYFLSLNVKPKIIKQILFNYEKNKYLNDELYAETYIKLKSEVEGPELIKEKLQKKGIPNAIIYEKLKQINEKEIIEKLILKKIKSIKNKSKKQVLLSLKLYVLSKGFQREMIDQVLYEQKDQIKSDQLSDIDPFYTKLSYKLKQKYQGSELNYHIKQKLYQKGFSIELIDAYLSKKTF
jgi:regulatory protein